MQPQTRPKPAAADSAFAQTPQALLAAAGEVFAEAGFRNATIRDICRRAHANVAAVNYHFGDKEQLYLAVLRFAQERAEQQLPAELEVPGDAPVQRRLRAYVHAYLLRIFHDGPTAWYGKLIAREMIEPTHALDEVVRRRVRPQTEQLSQIIRAVLGPRANPETVRLCGCSLVGQCLFYCHCRPVLTRMFPDMKFGPADIERLAEHITEFSLAALKHMARSRKRARNADPLSALPHPAPHLQARA